MNELRPYQTDIIAEFYRSTTEFKRIILVAPTGAGKTVIAGAIIKEYARRYRSVLMLAHRREIIDQTSRKLRDVDVPHGIIQAGTPGNPMAFVQVASIQTLSRRAVRDEKMELPPADLIIIDECHHALARTYQEIVDAYPNAIILGLTATPCRGDDRGLGGIFEVMIQCPQVAELIEQGHLVKSRVYAPSTPDLTGVRTQAGDYVESQLAQRMDKAELVADIVGSWHKYGEGRKTVCFATGVGHSIHLRDEFIASGVRAEHIDGGTPKAERDSTLERLKAGDIQLVTNCMVLTEGWDMPDAGTLILARPTKKMGLFRQMVGRVLRPARGKVDAIILDHSGAVFRHGLPEDHVDWVLDEDFGAKNRDHDKRKSETIGGPKLLECTQCNSIREGGKACPCCGFLPVRKPDIIIPADGDLALVVDRKPGVVQIHMQQFYNEVAGLAVERGRKPGYAYHKVKEKFGRAPPSWMIPRPCPPSQEVRSWCRSRDIAYWKALERAS